MLRLMLATAVVVGYADTSAQVRTLCASLPKSPRRCVGLCPSASAGFVMSGVSR